MASNFRKAIIVLIDSGVDTSISDLSHYIKKSTCFSMDSKGFIEENENTSFVDEHGTIVSMIIRHFCPAIEIISMNIFENELVTDGRILLRAFEKAVKIKPDIIHMSLGTTRWRYKLPMWRLVRKALKNNTLVVAAANNEGLKSYPAYLKKVVGVKAADCIRVNDYFYQNKFFYAPFGVNGIDEAKQLECKNPCGSSMAAAYITGHLARLKVDHQIIDNTLVLKKFIEIKRGKSQCKTVL